MDELFVISVDADGTATTTGHQTLEAAEQAFDAEKERVIRKEIVGVGLDQQDLSGAIHPQKGFMEYKSSGENVFLNTIKDLRQRGYRSA